MEWLAELPFSYLAPLTFVFGLVIGSFLNVVIHRVPRGEPLALPASHCPHCQTPIRPYDNVPLFSYLWLRGRCRQCQTRISFVYPLVELLTAVLFVAVVHHSGVEWPTLVELFFVAAMLALIFIDAQHHLLPDVLTYPLYLVALVFAPLKAGWDVGLLPQTQLGLSFGAVSEFAPGRAALSGGLLLATALPTFVLLDWLDGVLFDRFFEFETDSAEAETSAAVELTPDELRAEQRRLRAIKILLAVGALCSGAWALVVWRYATTLTFSLERAYEALLSAFWSAFMIAGAIWLLRAGYFLLRRVEGMGLGDVKMMAGVGAFLGWYNAFYVLLYGSLLGAIAGVVVTLRAKEGLQKPLPFGVCLGALAIWLLLQR